MSDPVRPRAKRTLAQLMGRPDIDPHLREPEYAYAVRRWARAEAAVELMCEVIAKQHAGPDPCPRCMRQVEGCFAELHEAATRAANFASELRIRTQRAA